MPLANASASPAHPVRALILTPTRELADQVYESVKRYSKQTPLRSAVVFGGVDIGPQREALRRNPGRHAGPPAGSRGTEEREPGSGRHPGAGRGRSHAGHGLPARPGAHHPPAARAAPGLLFSATFSNEIRKLGRSYLNQPVEIEVAARNATANTITQIAYKMSGDNKRAAVVHLVKSRGLKQVIVFSNTKIGTARLARQLERDGVKAESIHGDKTQADRMKALEAFKAGDLEVLVATDVAARGLDVAGVPCVINYDLPYNAEDYVHRIGRTGRAGASGEAIALFTAEEERFLLDIEKLIKREVPRGTLDVPADLIARSHGRGEERGSPREGREGRDRGERGDRGDRGRSSERGSERRSSYSAPRQPVDDFFLKPYEPSAAAPPRGRAGQVERRQAPGRRAARRQPQALRRGVGGFRRPSAGSACDPRG